MTGKRSSEPDRLRRRLGLAISVPELSADLAGQVAEIVRSIQAMDIKKHQDRDDDATRLPSDAPLIA